LQKRIIVCVNQRVSPDTPSCGSRGGIEIAEALEIALSATDSTISVERFYCLGCCGQGPNLKFSPNGEFWHDVHLEDVPQLVSRAAAFVQDV